MELINNLIIDDEVFDLIFAFSNTVWTQLLPLPRTGLIHTHRLWFSKHLLGETGEWSKSN